MSVPTDLVVELPEDETPGELMKGYFTLMRALGWDLYLTSHLALAGGLGQNWFAARIAALTQDDPKYWPPKFKYDRQDPSVILKDYTHESDSPYRAVFGDTFTKQSAAKKILSTRNTWFHFGDDPTTADLIEAAKIVRVFVLGGGMHIASRIEQLILRLQDLAVGKYPMRISVAEAVEGETRGPSEAPTRADDEIPLPTDLPRPPIGGTWLGKVPMLRYRLTNSGDIIHPDTMASVRDQVTGDASEKFRVWTAVEPRGRELWIDTDGAVGGFIGASPRLLGYTGPDPEGEIARGFFTKHYYSADGGEIVDLDCGERLKSVLADMVGDGASLRVTTYGDVIRIDDVNGVERVATVAPADWFPGHLG